MADKLTWRDVFDTTHKMWGHIDNVLPVVYMSGYTYFAWNGAIYGINSKGTDWIDTGLRIENLV